MRIRRAARSLTVAALCVLAGCGAERAALTVSAAASLQEPLQQLARSYESAHPGAAIALNFGGSGMLAEQIEQGAPADIFFPAAPQPMDSLAAHGLILPDTRRNLLRNQVVLIIPQNASAPDGFPALAAPSVKLLALGDPATVPAGDYGRAVLQSLGLWSAVQSKLVFAKDVRQVLTYVETGNTDAGIVYATDAEQSGKVKIVAVAPTASYPPVVYPAAVLRRSSHPAAARAFLDYLSSGAARAVFERDGFTVVAR
jgi:molybdate transport system substrate-binding protein